jgi:Protein of unknown function (DUF3592)
MARFSLNIGMPRTRWAWAAMALAGSLTCGGATSLYFGVASSSWPLADATITVSAERYVGRSSVVDIRYVYSVGGREYRGDRWRYSLSMNLTGMRAIDIGAALASYPVGTDLGVAVDPRRPARSVLEPGPQYADLVWIFSGMLIGLVGLLPGRSARPRVMSESPDAPPAHRHRLPIVLCVIGSLLLGTGLYIINNRMAAVAWPMVEARVLYSALGNANSVGNHRAEIRYEYFVSGRRYLGSESFVAHHDEAAAFIAAARPGQRVSVHCDPLRPDRSALTTSLSWHDFVLPALAFLFLGGAALASRAARQGVV